MLSFYDFIFVYFLIFFDNFSTYISAHIFLFGFIFSHHDSIEYQNFQLTVLPFFVNWTEYAIILQIQIGIAGRAQVMRNRDVTTGERVKKDLGILFFDLQVQ